MFASNTSQVSSDANYIEEVFSTYLVTGDGTAPAVNNGIDLSTKGGLVWTKKRSAAGSHSLFDTARGANLRLISNDTAAQDSVNLSFTTTGFSNYTFDSGVTYASWTFRKQPKFFDVVTYTGNNTAGRTVAHNLGSVPGCIIVKCTSTGGAWTVYHRSPGATKYLILNNTDAEQTFSGMWNNTDPTATEFTLGASGFVNAPGATYVAYLFAHNAGGFGLTGTDNVISCGSFTTDGSGAASVTLGYEPQWVLIKYNSNDSWRIFDNMRGMSQTNWAELYPNTSDAEVNRTNQTDLFVRPNATGFTTTWSPQAGNTAIYIAIRRGPMKVPTSGTSVFSPVLRNGTGANANIQSGFPTDLIVFLNTNREWDAMGNYWTDRMRSGLKYLSSTNTGGEGDWNNAFQNNNGFDTQNGVLVTSDVANGVINHSGTPYINWMFRRAPSFFDEVCYTGTGSATTQTHNLGVVPEMMIVKTRSDNANWAIYTASLGPTKSINFTTAAAGTYSVVWNDTAPTSSVFTVGTAGTTNNSGSTYVAYLFATCAGVSKVGSYTGTGTTKQVDCGFAAGARFVLIKRTDSTGDWYVWDSARGIVSGNDPYLLLNSTAAEVTNTDYVDTYSAGFEISSTAPAAINANGGSFIFLAIS